MSAQEQLQAAQAAFERGDFLEAFALCKHLVEEDSRNAPALRLFSQLCELAGNELLSLASLVAAQALEAEHKRDSARFEKLYAELMRRDYRLGIHTNARAISDASPDSETLALVRAALRVDPLQARIVATLGVLALRQQQIDFALYFYGRALELDPRFAEAALALAQWKRLRGHDDAESAFEHAMSLKRTYVESQDETGPAILIAMAPSFWDQNIPSDFLLSPRSWKLIKWFAGEEPPSQSASIIFNCIAQPSWQDALSYLSDYARQTTARIVNSPTRLDRTERSYLSRTFSHPDVVIPQTMRCATIQEFTENVARLEKAIVRPEGSHRGEGVQLVSPADPVNVEPPCYLTQFVDYRDTDGYYRKYRAIIVGSAVLPFHLAISNRWMVHYFSSQMNQHAWMRDEEAAFLDDMDAVIGMRAVNGLRAIAQAVAIDYFGVDFGLLPDGRVLVFEANVNMLVHDVEQEMFLYKRPAAHRIFDTLEALLKSKL